MTSAGKVMTLVRSVRDNPEWNGIDEQVKEKMFLKALIPIKSFMTRRGFARWHAHATTRVPRTRNILIHSES
jgi:hypothetical protein